MPLCVAVWILDPEWICFLLCGAFPAVQQESLQGPCSHELIRPRAAVLEGRECILSARITITSGRKIKDTSLQRYQLGEMGWGNLYSIL